MDDLSSARCPTCGEMSLVDTPFSKAETGAFVWNPLIALNELILGQRVPAGRLVCQTCDLPEYQRTYVPCRVCGTMNRGRSIKAFGNWTGLPCPYCGADLPCVRNIFAAGLTRITCPIWGPPYRSWRRRHGARRGRGTRPSDPQKLIRAPFLRAGLAFGLLSWIMIGMAPAGCTWIATRSVNWNWFIQGTVLSVIVGVAFGAILSARLGQGPDRH